MISALFILTLSAEFLSLAFVFISLLLPKHRVWPPDRNSFWKRILLPTTFVISGLGVVVLGILDWGSSVYPIWLRWLGVPFWLAGNGLALWAGWIMGNASTWGGEGEFISKGPYRFSRNPQYVGFILGLGGWALMVGSTRVAAACLVGAVAILLAPFAEETWLREIFGEPYERYRQTTPRFFSFSKVKKPR